MKTNTVRTLPVDVFSNPVYRKCANGGISETSDELYLICDEGFHDVPADDPRLLRLVERELFGSVYKHVEPGNPGDISGKVGPMSGGSFVYSCDSRFPSDYPLSVHDRYETQAFYDSMD